MSRRCPHCHEVYEDAVFFCGQDGIITIQVQDPSDTDQRLGTTLGGYMVVARVADGAMGRVYEGRHPETKARVAIKVLHPDVAKDHVAVERFKREYQTANEFDNPYIVKVLEFGETGDGSWFLTMEYLLGEELGELLRREGAIGRERVVRVLTQTAIALDYAHSFGVIHRDLKPDNIFLCDGDDGVEVRLLDFGSVKLQMEMGPKLTAFGTTLGSPYYMSPEQAMGKLDVDQRTDIFAVAAILFEMCTGRIAFEGSSVAEILMKIVNGTPPLASETRRGLPPGLDDVIQRGLAKDKTNRYESCAGLAAATLAAYG
ncbi:MAG: serine/threonine protein kinase, partial [Deltaproteobacteria bacterium]